jgi:leucyl aminopeptidase
MDFKTSALSGSAGELGLGAVAGDALLLVLCGSKTPEGLGAALGGFVKQAEKDGDFAFKPGQVLYAHQVVGIKAKRLVVVGGGDGSAKAWRKAVHAGMTALKGGGSQQVVVSLVGVALTAAHAEALVGATTEALYVYRSTKPSAPAPAAVRSVVLACDKAQTAMLNVGLLRGQAVAAGTALARECANRPGNHCTPSYLSEQARLLAKQHGLKVQVLDRKACEKLGMGSFLCVAQGSDEPLQFIVAQYLGGPKNQAPVVLVGKGITFDTGGISIKPAAEMDEMKFDMGGAASVLGTLKAVAQMKAKVNLIGIIPACENSLAMWSPVCPAKRLKC